MNFQERLWTGCGNQTSMRKTREFFESFKLGQILLQQETLDLKAGQQRLLQRTGVHETGQQELR